MEEPEEAESKVPQEHTVGRVLNVVGQKGREGSMVEVREGR